MIALQCCGLGQLVFLKQANINATSWKQPEMYHHHNVSHIIDCDSNDGIYDIINFGISLIISTLQNLMRNGWKGIHVESKFVGYEI